MVRIRADESFRVAVKRERRLFKSAPKEGIPAGASTSTGVPNKSKGSGEPMPMRRRRGCTFDEVFSLDSTSSSSCGPPTPPPHQMRTEGAGVTIPKKSKVFGSYGPATPPPGMQTHGANKSKGSGSCGRGPAMPLPGMRTEGAGLSQKSKGPSSYGPATTPPGVQTEGAGVPEKSMGSGSYGPAMPPSWMPPERAGVSELTLVDTDALNCGVCFLPLKPPIFQCNNGHVVCLLCHDKLKATGKCHVCGVTTDGNSRCHAMERLAGSIRFLCPNAAYGCTARPVYHDRKGHWQKCPYSPYRCPDKACDFTGPMELLLDHFACVHGWPSFTTAPASGHFNASLHDGFNFLHADDQASSSPGILFVLNVVRRPLGRAISMRCIDTRAASNVQGQFSKEPIECELTYSRYVGSKSRTSGDQLTDHYQRCKFRVALTDLSNGLPSTDDCFQFVVPNFALGEGNKETVQVQGRIFISSINMC